MTNSVDTSLWKPVLTIADLISQIERDPSLNPRQRTANNASMGTLVRIIAASTRNGVTTASNITCDVSSLNNSLFRLPAKAHNLKKVSFGNVVTHLRTRLRRNGLLDEAMGVGIPADSPWTTLLESIKDAHAATGFQSSRLGAMRMGSHRPKSGTAPLPALKPTCAPVTYGRTFQALSATLPKAGARLQAWRRAGPGISSEHLVAGIATRCRSAHTPSRSSRILAPSRGGSAAPPAAARFGPKALCGRYGQGRWRPGYTASDRL